VTRVLDIILSSIALIVLFPFMILVMLILKLTGEHYIFYGQTRIGRNGKSFKLLKFATMLKDSPLMGAGDITVKYDPRVLPFGGFLRKTKINELPQLINILIGDMSVVGPRPQTPKNFDYFPSAGK
jgi:lipopolysaccharide/colanic/teichoic acid biosynthesis glycosyltransferase